MTDQPGPEPIPALPDPVTPPQSTAPEPVAPPATSEGWSAPAAAPPVWGQAGSPPGWGRPAPGAPPWVQPAWGQPGGGPSGGGQPGGGQPGWNQPPWGQPAWGGHPWPPPRVPAPAHRARTAAILIAIFAGAAAGGVAVAVATNHSSSPGQSSLLPANAPGSSGTGNSANGQQPSAPLPTVPSQPSGGGTSAALDPTAIAARIDPSVVDITVTLTGTGTAQGTGMILTSSGTVLTNNHVVEGAIDVSVQVNGTGPVYKATVIGVDPVDDVALVQMTGASGLPTVPLGSSSSVAVGDHIVALGNALGRGGAPAVTPGTVTAIDQTITATDASGGSSETLANMIEVQAGIQPGDSGGPLVDSTAHVVGMTTAGSARARRTGTVGFAIPIDKAMKVAQQIQSGSGPNVQGPHRGIMGVQINAAAAAGNGAVVAGVQSGSPAAAAGIANGAVITKVDSTSIASADALSKAMAGRKPGDKITVEWRDAAGQQHSAPITLASGPPA